MAKHFSNEQDVLGNLLAACELQAGEDAEQEKNIIERLQVQLGGPSGVRLSPGRVHALSTVRRRRPLYLLPPRPPVRLNRSQELEGLYDTISNYGVAELNGPDGVGKSTLAAALVHTLDLDRFPDGVVYVTGRVQSQDLLQALFDCFYESDNPVKITPQQAPTYLYNLRALVILDEVGLGPQQLDPVLDALGHAAVLVVGSERTALGRGQPFALKGLPREEAVALFAAGLGRSPSADEYPIIEQVCGLLNDMPLPISCLTAQAAGGQGALTALSNNLVGYKPWAGPGGDLSVGPSLEQLVLTLDETDRQLLTLTAAFIGPSASSEALITLTGLPAKDFQKHVKNLQELGLIDVVELKSRRRAAPRLTLAPAYHQAIRTWLVDDTTRLDIVDYYATRLSRGDRLEGTELPNLLGAIQDCAHHGLIASLKPLVSAANQSLAWLGWWAGWQHVLDLTRRAAQAAGDRALEAWATHQLGSRLGALGVASGPRGANRERTLHLLQTALDMRQALEDEEGAALSAHNLELLDRLLPAPIKPVAAAQPPPEARQEPGPEGTLAEAPAPPPRARRSTRSVVRLALLGALIVLVVGALGLRFALQNGGNGDGEAELTVSWEFGDAWNANDNQSWSQQVLIVAEGGAGEYRYFADGEPVGEMFTLTLPICDGARGVIEVQSGDEQAAQVEYEFDPPFCR